MPSDRVLARSLPRVGLASIARVGLASIGRVGFASIGRVGLASMLALAACARGRVLDDGVDAGRLDAARHDGAAVACEPACSDGEVCVDGTCRPEDDADGDGVSAELDCDDTDARLGRLGERTCSSSCGAGVERCTDGVWSACSAPTDCACEAGAPSRTIACERCGTQTQICLDGAWTNDGECNGGACSPGELETGGACGNCGLQTRVCGADCTWGAWTCAGELDCRAGTTEPETEACGTCGAGTRTRSRTCGADCRWADYGDWSACSGDTGGCTAGETQSETRACGNCELGTQSRSRTCSASCAWGSWGAWSTCAGGGTCAPGATQACDNGDSCGHEVCSDTCTWGSCEPTVSGGCLRIRPGTSGPAGNNYRCCTISSSDQGWQFCLPSCQWSTSCDATTSC